MSNSTHISDVTGENFEEVVIRGSFNQLVIADFWADWCQPCQTLMPVLKKLSEDYQGKFHLAKINSDEHQELAAQYSVRSLPTVKFFLNGEVVDEFMGVISEPEIRAKLDQYIARESDGIMAQALQLIEDNHYKQAEDLLNQVNAMDPGQIAVISTLAELNIKKGDLSAAEAHLLTLSEDMQKSAEIASLLSQIDFTRQSDSLPPVDELINVIDNNPDDLQCRYDLVLHYITERNYEHAMAQLLEIMQRDRSFKDDIGRTTLLKLFDSVPDDALVAHYRRAMFNMMY